MIWVNALVGVYQTNTRVFLIWQYINIKFRVVWDSRTRWGTISTLNGIRSVERVKVRKMMYRLKKLLLKPFARETLRTNNVSLDVRTNFAGSNKQSSHTRPIALFHCCSCWRQCSKERSCYFDGRTGHVFEINRKLL